MMKKKYNNQHYPHDFNEERLRQKINEYSDRSEEKDGLDNDKVRNMVFAAKAQLGLAELHKRQNDKTNRITIRIAFMALLVSLVSAWLQYEAFRPIKTQINTQELESPSSLGTHLPQKIDSMMSELKSVQKRMEGMQTQSLILRPLSMSRKQETE